MPGVDEGIMRLFALTEGVAMGVCAAGVLRDELVTDRALSLLRERLDDDGDIGIPAGAMSGGSVRIWTPLTFALRLKARSLCSLKALLSLSGNVSELGRGGTTKFGD